MAIRIPLFSLTHRCRAVAAALILTLSFPSLGHAGEPRNAFVNFGGTQVHYVDVGTGSKALVLVHGWACNADFWKATIGAFPEYRMIAVDLPGHGRSAKPLRDYAIEYFARSIAAVMRDAGVTQAILAGHSMGVPVVRQFYRRHPERTLGLIVVDGPLRSMPPARLGGLIELLRANYQENAAKSIDESIEPIRDEKLKQEIRSAMLATPDYVGLSALQAMADRNIWAYEKINIPVLAIFAQSPQWEPDLEAFVRSMAPEADVQIWPGVSHFLMMECPAAFNDAVRRFVSQNKLL